MNTLLHERVAIATDNDDFESQLPFKEFVFHLRKKIKSLLRSHSADAESNRLSVWGKLNLICLISELPTGKAGVDITPEVDQLVARRTCTLNLLSNTFRRVKKGVDSPVIEKKYPTNSHSPSVKP